MKAIGIRVTLATICTLALPALPASAQALERTLVAGDGAAGDNFGNAVDVDGDTAVVGAPDANSERGAVYVFTRAGTSWTQTAKLTAADGGVGDRLGSSVAIDGDVIVAGAPLSHMGLSAEGAAYTFARSGSADRTQTAKLTAFDGEAGDALGISVAIDGDTIVAGNPFDDVAGEADRGSAYTFARTGPDRPQTSKLTAADGEAGDALGLRVAIDGDTIVAGATAADVGAIDDQGAAYTFATTGNAQRTETAKLSASNGDALGVSVAIDGDTIVAGATGADVGRGAAYTFASTGNAHRTETAKLTASDGATEDQLGHSVAIEGATIVAGAVLDDVGANEKQGSAYTFASTGAANRTQTGRLIDAEGAAFNMLGRSVAIDGATIVAGAWGDDVGANVEQGSASIFFAPSVADLAIAKTAAPGPVTVGDQITYTLSVKNSGPDAATGVKATDDLPAGAGFKSASAGCASAAGKVTCSFGTIASGATESARIVVTANRAVSLVNSASVEGAEPDLNPANDEDGATTLVQLPDDPPADDPPADDPPDDDPPPDDGSVPCPEGTSDTVVCSLDERGRTRFAGTRADETFVGTKSDDIFKAGAGKDKIEARGGDDKLAGQGGKDSLMGQGGKDRLNGSGGKDSFRGGGGNDRINSRGQKREKVDCGAGKRDRVKGAKGDRVKRNCEKVKR